ncbi:MAG TPA: hypothetical protein VHU84_10230 [Lacipirellulaceae bacterium]|jgi:hypothetical protein|nr:hypothetical protein [Lacipirellulaceae bacterium]
MATVFHSGSVPSQVTRASTFDQPAYQGYVALYVGFVILPIVAGFDKFFDVLTNWDTYLAPIVTQWLGMNAHPIMLVVGVIEIIAGLIVLFRPQIGAYIVGVWLLGIIANLLLHGGAYDIVLRDVGLAVAAFALARISAEFNPRPIGV